MERDPRFMYRVARSMFKGRWIVTAYHGAEAIHNGSYTDEGLPEWVRKDIALLNMVKNDDAVPSIGHRVGEAYWLQPKDKNESCTGV